MKISSSILFSFILCGAITAAPQETTVTIKGIVHGDTKGYNKVYIYQSDQGLDSTIIVHNQFEFKLPFKAGMMPSFFTEYDIKVRESHYNTFAVIETPGVLVLKDIDITKGLISGTWTGMQSAQDYQKVSMQLFVIMDETKRKLDVKYGLGNENSLAYQKEQDSLNTLAISDFRKAFAKLHPDSYGLMAALNQSRGVTHVSVADQEEVYNMLSEKIRNSTPGKDFGAFLVGLKNSAIGNSVKDFTLYTPASAPLKFSSFKGKYVLVDFWASWCGPCRQSIPHLKEMYQKYQGNKFEIYSISTDANKADWIKAINKENMPWLQALDNINISASSFGVQALPTAFLIDPEGKILAKEVGFNAGDLENSVIGKKIIELFKN